MAALQRSCAITQHTDCICKFIRSRSVNRRARAHSQVISKAFVAKNWGAAMAFLNLLSDIAEDEGHHPDVHLTNWRDVRIDLSTHAIGGLSMPDLVLAAKIDAIPVEFSPKWLREKQATDSSQAKG